MRKMIAWMKQEAVLTISFLLAFVSSFIIRPDAGYLAYPDYRTLALLFCLMIIVAGLQEHGVFALLGQALIKKSAQSAYALHDYDSAVFLLQHGDYQRRDADYIRAVYHSCVSHD